jgi:hypothetical protein
MYAQSLNTTILPKLLLLHLQLQFANPKCRVRFGRQCHHHLSPGLCASRIAQSVSAPPLIALCQSHLCGSYLFARAIISYLQVMCEQHRLVEQHLSKFTHPDSEAIEEVRPGQNAVAELYGLLAEPIKVFLDQPEANRSDPQAAESWLHGVVVASRR